VTSALVRNSVPTTTIPNADTRSICHSVGPRVIDSEESVAEPDRGTACGAAEVRIGAASGRLGALLRRHHELPKVLDRAAALIYTVLGVRLLVENN